MYTFILGNTYIETFTNNESKDNHVYIWVANKFFLNNQLEFKERWVIQNKKVAHGDSLPTTNENQAKANILEFDENVKMYRNDLIEISPENSGELVYLSSEVIFNSSSEYERKGNCNREN